MYLFAAFNVVREIKFARRLNYTDVLFINCHSYYPFYSVCFYHTKRVSNSHYQLNCTIIFCCVTQWIAYSKSITYVSGNKFKLSNSRYNGSKSQLTLSHNHDFWPSFLLERRFLYLLSFFGLFVSLTTNHQHIKH